MGFTTFRIIRSNYFKRKKPWCVKNYAKNFNTFLMVVPFLWYKDNSIKFFRGILLKKINSQRTHDFYITIVVSIQLTSLSENVFKQH